MRYRAKIVRGGLGVRTLDLDLHVEPAGSQDRRVDEVLAVRRADHDDVAQPLDAVDLGEQLRHDRRFHVGRDARAAGAEHRVHLVEEHDDRPALLALLPGPLEHQADLALGLADVLVEQFGALDVDEVAAALALAHRVGDLLGEAVGDRLGDERLAAPGRAVEQDPLGRRQLMLGEQVLVEERQLDRVGDLLDLVVEPADVGVGDVGHLLEQQVLDLGPRQLLEQQVRRGVEAHVVAAAERVPRSASASSQTRSSSARPTTSARTPSSITSLIVTTSPVISGSRASTTLKLSLSTTSEPRSSSSWSISGCSCDPHLAAAREDVDRAVVVLADDDAVRRRRLGQLVDLVAQRGDVLARLAQRVAQLLVLADGLGQLALGLEQPLLERAHALRRVGQARPQVRDLLVEQRRRPARVARRRSSSMSDHPIRPGCLPSFAMSPTMYTRLIGQHVCT